MSAHWTYEPAEPSAELEQGDILHPTDALRGIFSEVHPHFRHDKYLGFMVATQSCDLVRRRSGPKALYINLAVVRPLAHVIHKILAQVADPITAGIFKSSDKGDARRLLERVLNQNEQAIGLFYLHPDVDAGIAEPAVAFLRVTVSLRAEHYDDLCAARRGRLKPAFRAKLGWLMANLYDRPATSDGGDIAGGKKTVDGLISQYISEARWIDDEVVTQAIAQGVNVAQVSPESLEALRPISRLERALQEVQAELSRIAPELSTEAAPKLLNRLRNSGKFIKLFK